MGEEAKFRLDDIVLPESLASAREFECAVCLCIAQEPAVQAPCGHVYCRECLAPCSACPQCREPFEASAVRLLSEANKLGRRIMHGLKVRCPYGAGGPRADESAGAGRGARDAGDAASNKAAAAGPRAAKRPRRCEEDSCQWSGSYGDLLAKHFCECALHPVPCPQGCGAVLPRGQLAAHRMSCEKSFEDCWICGERVRVGALPQHNKEKAEQHVELLAAKLQASEAAASEQKSLSMGLARVEEQVRGRASTAHVSTVVKTRAEEVKAEVRAQIASLAVKRVEWTVRDVRRLTRNTPAGDCIESRQFAMGGVEGFSLMFFPKGMHSEEVHDPLVAVNHESGDTDAVVKISVGDQSETSDEDHPWEDLYLMMDLTSPPGDRFTIRAELLSGGCTIKL